MDWLHAADQGITADFIGNCLYYLVQFFPGSNEAERYNSLHAHMEAYYIREGVPDRLDCLKKNFVLGSGGGVKLKCSAAKCRQLVPYIRELCSELCDPENPVEQSMLVASEHLQAVYECLSSSHANAAETFKDNSIKFALQYVALSDHFQPVDDRLFRIKPKLHFFLHLCSDGGQPSQHWCYRDEDFGGSIAKAARRRGGMSKPGATSTRVLQCLAIGTPLLCVK